jgi:transcriptional regulator with XRE-family HTH domain
MTVGKRLDRAMKEAHMTQYRLAQLSGVPQPTIARIISGQTKEPTRKTMDRLARALHRATETLYNHQEVAEAPASYTPIAVPASDEVAITQFLALSEADRKRIRAIIAALTQLEPCEDDDDLS